MPPFAPMLPSVPVGVPLNGGTVTGPILFAAGTVGAPSVGWSADADGAGTGFYRPAADQVGVTANGVLVATFEHPSAPRITLADGCTVAVGTTTGTVIGSSATQKVGFHSVAPSARRAGAAQAAAATTAATNVAPFGYTTAAQADAIRTLVNEIRDTLVEKGLMKGSA